MSGIGILQHLVLTMILPGKTVICFSVEDQMEQSSLYFWDLLEGSEKPVVGTTCEFLKKFVCFLNVLKVNVHGKLLNQALCVVIQGGIAVCSKFCLSAA